VNVDVNVSRVWRNKLLTEDHWEPDPNIERRPGLYGGQWMRCIETNNRAWEKPQVHTPGKPRCVREKVASDLAYELELPVPPVLLRFAQVDPYGLLPKCLSLRCSSKQPELSDLFDVSKANGGKPDLLSFFKSSIPPTGIAAFHAWLGNEDWKNPRNILVSHEATPGAEGLLFIDFAESLSWTENNQVGFARISLPPFYQHFVARNETIDVALQIQALSEVTIRGIVNRVPDQFIDGPARELLISGLLARKESLLPAFEEWYPKLVEG